MLSDGRTSLSTSVNNGAPGPVMVFQYRSTTEEQKPELVEPEEEVAQDSTIRLTAEALAQRLMEERALGEAEAETRMRRDYEQRLAHEQAGILETIRSFEQIRKQYFASVEGEVVQLALSIARKVLHRESQVDPLLLTALVQIALTQIKEGSAVVMRVRPEEAPRWRERLKAAILNVEVTVVEESERAPGECVVETELGTVNLGLDAQLKEVEQGFLDVLARTPQF